MLDLLNRYCLGYIITPILEACHQYGFVEMMDSQSFQQREWLVKELNANEVYLTLMLQILEDIGEVENNSKDAYRLCKKRNTQYVDYKLSELYQEKLGQLDIQLYLPKLSRIIRTVLSQSKKERNPYGEYYQGSIIISLFFILRELNVRDSLKLLKSLDESFYKTVQKLFSQNKWLKKDGDKLNSNGKRLLASEQIGQITLYRPLLSKLGQLIFTKESSCVLDDFLAEKETLDSQFDSIFNTLLSNDRNNDLQAKIIELLDREPLSEQAKVIVLSGRDKTFIKKLPYLIYETTLRGKYLAQYPLQIICLGNEKLELERVSAATSDIKFTSLVCNIGDQNECWRILNENNIPIDDSLLYVNDFSTLISSESLNGAIDASLLILAKEIPSFYLSENTTLLSDLCILNNLYKQLEVWAESINKSGLLVSMKHIDSLDTTCQEKKNKRSAYIDYIHHLSSYPLISANAFLVLAANVGLFNIDTVKINSDKSICRTSVHQLEKRDYRIRHALQSDLERLEQLELLCWTHTQTSKQGIEARIVNYPEGQFVLEKNNEVLGVIYSQRIIDVKQLDTVTAENVHDLHNRNGKVVQLLAINIDPEVQNYGYGDQLLEFMLQRSSLLPEVFQVVGVTLCKNFNAQLHDDFLSYIHLQGVKQDSVLAFHQAHGAEVVKAIPNYRKDDIRNHNYGVLISYDIHTRIPYHCHSKHPAENVKAISSEKEIINKNELIIFLQKSVASLLNIRNQKVDFERPVMEMGLNSADLLKLQLLIEEKINKKLQHGFFFEFNTLSKVVEHFIEILVVADNIASFNEASRKSINGKASKEKKANNKSAFSSNDIAIIGVSCKLPGGIADIDDLWEVLISEKSAISNFPESRGVWPKEKKYIGIKKGGFVLEAGSFDANFFRISPTEAETMDPQQRMLLELTWKCIEDACILPSSLKGSNTGVFIGASNNDYSRLLQNQGEDVEAHHGTGSSLAILANRLSYFFDISGPSLLIDTACSSSLVALHSSIQSLRNEECKMALVGGVNLICHPDLSIAYHKSGMLAPDGRCKVFDENANGYVRSEGAVMLLLKPFDEAYTDGNQIHGIIKGSAINHGGLAGGLTVPNPVKQSELLNAAWDDAGICAQELSYIEAHGTGTSLGDPIEVQGILKAYAKGSPEVMPKSCGLGSVKSNLGHLESAAGLAGLVKVIVSMKHKELPATINFSQLNPKIKIENSALFIQQEKQAWKPQQQRIAGVSSFGSGGTNAHVVLCEYINNSETVVNQKHHLFVLSALSQEQLKEYTKNIIRWLERKSEEVNLVDAIYSWQTGRVSMSTRLAIKVDSFSDLKKKLNDWLTSDSEIENAWFGHADKIDSKFERLLHGKMGFRLIEQALTEYDLEQIGLFWASGGNIDWQKLYNINYSKNQKPKLISLPSYPFAKEYYWLDAKVERKKQDSLSSSLKLHPLLHYNTSDFNQQSYQSIFHGKEFFLADHQIKGKKVLPAVSYLEMIRAAIEDASDKEKGILELQHIAWAQPIISEELTKVNIALVAENSAKINYEIYSLSEGEEILHCQGQAMWNEVEAVDNVEIDLIEVKANSKIIDSERLYADLKRIGLEYGKGHQGLKRVYEREDEIIAELVLPNHLEHDFVDYFLHPSLLDSALQASLGLVVKQGIKENELPLPYAIEHLRILANFEQKMLARIRFNNKTVSGNQLVKLDIDLFNTEGVLCVQIQGFSFRALKKEIIEYNQTGSIEHLIMRPIWETKSIEKKASDDLAEVEHYVFLYGIKNKELAPIKNLLPEAHCHFATLNRAATLAENYNELAWQCFHLIKKILQAKPQKSMHLQVVINDSDMEEISAGLSSLLKTAKLENPRFSGQLILLNNIAVKELVQCLQDNFNQPHDTLIRYYNAERQVEMWKESNESFKSARAFSLKEGGVYIITGGLGGLGQLFSREFLNKSPNSRLILTGRTELTKQKQKILKDLTTESRVEYRKLDLSHLLSVESLFDELVRKYGQINGIIHSAGMIADNFILKKNKAEFYSVLEPKVIGAYHLDLASRKLDLDFIALFSSIVGVAGNLGQSDYGVANGFMERYAEYRNKLVKQGKRKGLTVAINWPLWEEGGMKVDLTSEGWLRKLTGMKAMRKATGLNAFHYSLSQEKSRILIIEGDKEKIRKFLTSNWFIESKSEAKVHKVVKNTLKVEGKNLKEKTLDYIKKQLSSVLKLPFHKIDAHAPMEKYGIDSILAMDLTSQLEKGFGTLSKTLFFEYQTITELCQYFIGFHKEQLEQLFDLNLSQFETNSSNSKIESIPLKPSQKIQFQKTKLTARIKIEWD